VLNCLRLPIFAVLAGLAAGAADADGDRSAKSRWSANEKKARNLKLVVDRVCGIRKSAADVVKDPRTAWKAQNGIDVSVHEEARTENVSSKAVEDFIASELALSGSRTEVFRKTSELVAKFFEPHGVAFLEPHVAQIVGEGTRGRNEIENASRPGSHVFVNSKAGKIVYNQSISVEDRGGKSPAGTNRPVAGPSGYSTVQTKPGGFRTLTSDVLYPSVSSHFQGSIPDAGESSKDVAGIHRLLISSTSGAGPTDYIDYRPLSGDVVAVSINSRDSRRDSFYLDYSDSPVAEMRLPQLAIHINYGASGAVELVELVSLRNAAPSPPLTEDDLKVAIPPNTYVERLDGEKKVFAAIAPQGSSDVAMFTPPVPSVTPAKTYQWTWIVIANITVLLGLVFWCGISYIKGRTNR
jgi:hypothetical protein